MDTTWKAGLEDVIAARSAICRVDGEAGRLYYRGYEIGDLTRAVSFEDVTAVLWFGELPSTAEAVAFAARLRAARGLPAPVKALLERLPRDTHPLDALRTAVSLTAAHDPDARSSDREANLRKAVRLMTLVPETVAAWQRIRAGQAPVEAPGMDSHATYFLELLSGRAPAPEVARVLDVVLTLHADHEFNASTFAGRVAIATLADLHAAVVAAIATLKGPRHGGANEDVLAMLREIGDPACAEAFVERRPGAWAAPSARTRWSNTPTTGSSGPGPSTSARRRVRSRASRGGSRPPSRRRRSRARATASGRRCRARVRGTAPGRGGRCRCCRRRPPRPARASARAGADSRGSLPWWRR